MIKAAEANTDERLSVGGGRSYTQTFFLPGGYVDAQGRVHREVQLAPMTGLEEEFLASVEANICLAGVVTALLTRCVKRVGVLEPVTTSLVRDLLVCDREFLTLKLREITFGNELNLVLFCGAPDCGNPMDLKLNLDDFVPEPKPLSSRFFTLDFRDREDDACKFSVEFRLPTGADQEAAAAWIGVDDESAVRQLLARTIARVNDETSIDEESVGALPLNVLREIEEQMERLAPHVAIVLETSCLECKKPFSTPLDLTSFFLTEIKRSLGSLEREVHFLAFHYHWPESEILALTRRKRRRYIELIQEASLGVFTAEAHRSGTAS